MKFTDKEYLEALGYVQGMFSLGGLSECGKTSAGYKLQDMGARKSKIIHIEREMMEERGYDLSQGMKDEHFVNLYAENQNQAFREFLFRLIGHMKEEGKPFASIESLYRAELGAFLKRELKGKMANIFIDAPVEARAKRELEKVNAKASFAFVTIPRFPNTKLILTPASMINTIIVTTNAVSMKCYFLH